MRRAPVSALAVLVASLACGADVAPPPPPAGPAPAVAEPVPARSGVRPPDAERTSPWATRDLPASSLPAGVLFVGTFERAVLFGDANGDNYVVFSVEDWTGIGQWEIEASSRKLHAVHWAVKDGAARQLRDVFDQVEPCEFDLTAAFLPEAFSVTDLDGDRIGEVTFAYELACRSDVSPTTLKLLLLENGDKYIVRGTSVVQVGYQATDVAGGEKTPDESVTKGPAAFRTHLDAVWERIVRR